MGFHLFVYRRNNDGAEVDFRMAGPDSILSEADNPTPTTFVVMVSSARLSVQNTSIVLTACASSLCSKDVWEALWSRARRLAQRSLGPIMALLPKFLEIMCHLHSARVTYFMPIRHKVLRGTSTLQKVQMCIYASIFHVRAFSWDSRAGAPRARSSHSSRSCPGARVT